MSDPFAAADDAIFAGLGVAAIYKAAGTGPDTAVTVIRENPTADASGFGVPLRAGAQFISVRVAEVAVVSDGDTFTIGSEVLTVRGAPARDGQAMMWRAEC